MARYAPVMPVRLLQDYLQQTTNHPIYSRTNYFLLLAHDIIDPANTPIYERIFKDRRSRVGVDLDQGLAPPESFVILDNSMVELGQPVPASDLVVASQIVDANCIVLPDVMGDTVATLNASYQAATAIHQILPDAVFMAVIQGKNIPQLSICALNFSLIPGVKYFGCPRWIANEFGTRGVFDTILGLSHKVKHPVVHMLGMSQNLEDDIQYSKLPGVMGMDSANPVVMGQQNRTINGGGITVMYEHLPRKTDTFDYWKEETVTEETLENIRYISRHIGR